MLAPNTISFASRARRCTHSCHVSFERYQSWTMRFNTCQFEFRVTCWIKILFWKAYLQSLETKYATWPGKLFKGINRVDLNVLADKNNHLDSKVVTWRPTWTFDRRRKLLYMYSFMGVLWTKVIFCNNLNYHHLFILHFVYHKE